MIGVVRHRPLPLSPELGEENRIVYRLPVLPGFFEGMAPVKENGLWGYVASSADAQIIREIADLHSQ